MKAHTVKVRAAQPRSERAGSERAGTSSGPKGARFRLLFATVAVAVLASCVSYDYQMAEYIVPAYSGLVPDAVDTITEEYATWYTGNYLGNRRAATTQLGNANRFTTLGPGEPHIYVAPGRVYVLEFVVTEREESTVSARLVGLNLNNHRAGFGTSTTVLPTSSVTVPRVVATPADLTEDDLEPILSTFTPPSSAERVQLFPIEDQQGELFRKYQAVAPEHSLYVHIETGAYVFTSQLAHHWYVGRFTSPAATVAAIADPETRLAVQQAESERIALAAQEAAEADRVAQGEPEPVRREAETLDFGDIEAEEGETVTIELENGTYTGEVANGRPDGEGRLEYTDGRVYEGGFAAGRFQGRAVLTTPDGRRLETTFNDGVPDGEGVFYFASDDAYEVSYDNGRRVDGRFLEQVLPNLTEAESLRSEIESSVRDGLPESAYATNVEALNELNRQLDGETGAERLLFEFDIDDQFVRFRVNEDGLVVSRYEEVRVEGDDGELLAIYREGDTLAVTDQGVGLRVQREELERLTEPQRDARFLTLVAGGGAGIGAETFVGGATFGVDYRYMNNSGENLPGPAGGSGRGWDFRGVGDISADYQSYSQQNDFLLSVAGGISAGRTTYRFEPLDRETLEQTGSGSTWGIQLLFSWDIIRPPLPEELEAIAPDWLTRPWQIIPAPFLSFEDYRYSPGTTRLESRTTQVQLLLGGVIGIYVTRTLVSF